MRRDITPDNGESLELHTWLITLCVLVVSVLLQCATISHRSDKEEASGEDLSKHYAHTVMQSKAAKRDTSKGGKGVRKFENAFLISLPTSHVRFYDLKVLGS